MSKKRIGVDIGHEGLDSGAISKPIDSKGTKMKESKINRNVGNKLIALLRIAGYEVFEVKIADTTLSLTERARRLNNAKCDLAVSIHHNAGGGDGFDIIFQMDIKYTKQSKIFADLLEKEFIKLNNKHRVFSRAGTKNKFDDYYTILALTNCPMIIGEFAFIDTDDVKEIDSLIEQHEEAMAYFHAIQKYFGRE